MGVFSSGIAEPTGSFSLAKKSSPVLDALENLSSDNPLTSIILEGGDSITFQNYILSIAGGPCALVNDDGTLLFGRGVASSTRIDDGIYDVTSSVTFPSVGGVIQCAVHVTPQGVVPAAGESSFEDYLGLTTTLFDPGDAGAWYDPVRGRVWATDISHDNAAYTIPDRLGILRLDTGTWEYITLPTTRPNIDHNKCSLGIMDLTNRVFYLQAFHQTGPVRSTLVYSLDTYALLQDTWDLSGHGQGTYHIVVGADPSRNKVCIWGDSTLRLYNTASGVPTTLADSKNRTGNTGFRNPITSNDGAYWFYDNAPSPDEWLQCAISGSVWGSFTNRDADNGNGHNMDSNLYTHNPVTDEIYYMAGAGNDELYKVLCVSPFTVTKINSSTYAGIGAGTWTTSIAAPTAISWSPDYYRLIVVRASPTYGAVYVVDPSDGSIDVAYELDDRYSRNYNALDIGVDHGRIWSIGSNRIQEFRFTGSTENTSLVVYKPVAPAARMTSTTKARVELFQVANSYVRQDNPFYISFHGTAA